MKKLSYFNGNENYGEEYYPFNEFMPTGMVQEYTRDLDRYENQQRDGNDFKEFDEFKKDNRINRIKKLRKLLKNKKKDVFEPHPFYESLYGTPADLTGVYTSPLEYYDGTIIDGPDNLVNPYDNSYQGNSFASSDLRRERLKIRANIFDKYLGYGGIKEELMRKGIPIIENNSPDLVNFHTIKTFKTLEEAGNFAIELVRGRHEEVVIWHIKQKHNWLDPNDINHRTEIKHFWEVGQI